MGQFGVNGRTVDVIHGDALAVIPTLAGPFAAVVTDPPYASGATSLAGKQQDTARKYVDSRSRHGLPNFAGDSLDQRSWTRWMGAWMMDIRARCVPGAPLCVFCDWRQLPALTDAVQWAGWLWRGVAVWDKVNSRPQRGRFRQQAEFLVWASNGPMPIDRNVGFLPGVLAYTQPMTGARYHQTQKPLDLMRQIVRICEPGGTIIDPFCGSGTTLLAAALEGYDAVGIEVSEYYDVACDRLAAEVYGDRANK